MLSFSESEKYGHKRTYFAIQNNTWGGINLP